jgi:hypothetical protein
MKRLAPAAVVCVLLALAPGASARVIELGSDPTPAKSKCPANPCEVVGRVTGYQGRSDQTTTPFVAPSDGKVVAFTISLAKLEQNQISYFTNLYGGVPQARLTILRRGKRKKTRLDHRVMAQSPIVSLQHYLGSTPSFALDQPLSVRKGHIVALTIPTWAPAFARDLSKSNWWRSSRRKKNCDSVTQRAAQLTVGNVATYGCTYHTARLLYTATFVTTPRPTDRAPRTRR